MTPIEAHALSILIEDQIEQLIRTRRWYRTTAGTLRKLYPDMETRDITELRALLKLRRMAKQVARAAQIEQDRAVDAWKERVHA